MDFNKSATLQLFSPRYSWLHIWICGSILVLLIFCTIIGNVFVIAAIILEKNLQSVSNYLILSLAVADMMVAVLVMPISAIYEMSQVWWMGIDLCDMWVFFDVLCCTASVFHLVAIAIDRYCAVTRVRFPQSVNNSRKKTMFMIVSVWILSVLISIPSRFHGHRHDNDIHADGHCSINNSEVYIIVANFGVFFLPMSVIIGIYIRIYIFVKQQIKKHSVKERVKKIVDKRRHSNRTHKFLNFSSILAGLSIVKKQHKDKPNLNSSKHELTSETYFILSPNSDRFEIEKHTSRVSLYDKSYGQNIIDFPYVDDTDDVNPYKPGLSALDTQGKRKTMENSTEDISFHIYSPLYDSVKSLNSSELFCNNCILALESELELSNFEHLNYSDIVDTVTSHGFEHNDQLNCPRLLSKEMKIATQQNDNVHLCINEPECRQSLVINKHKLSNAMWYQLKIRSRIKLEEQRESKAARTLAILTGCFIICWLPFALQNMTGLLLNNGHKTETGNNKSKYLFIDSFLLWLGYTNSCLNPIIYTVFSPDFREAFRKIVFGRYSSRGRRTL